MVQISKTSVDGLQVDSKPPDAIDVQTRDRGAQPGDPQAGDQLVLTYSETMDTTTLIPGWSGKDPFTAELAVTPAANGTAEARFPLPGSRDKPALGTIEMNSGGYSAAFGSQPSKVTVASAGRTSSSPWTRSPRSPLAPCSLPTR